MDDPQGPGSADRSLSDGSGGNGGADPERSEYWCYQCNKEVVALREQGVLEDSRSRGVVCAECRNGFIEVITTAQPDLQRGSRRRRRARGGTRTPTVELSETLEHLYPHQLMQLMQLLSEATPFNDTTLPAVDENHAAGPNPSELVQPPPSSPPVSWEERADENIAEVHAIGQNISELDRPVQTFPPAAMEERVMQNEDQFMLPTEADAGASLSEVLQNLSDERNLRRIVFVRQRVQRQAGGDDDDDGENENEDGDDNSDEEGVQLELEGWHSGGEDDDPEEWEEVEDDGDDDDDIDNTDDEVDNPTRERSNSQLDGEATVATNDGPTAESQHERQHRQRPRVRERQNLRFRVRNVEQNLHHYLLELLQNMVGRNVEVRVELPDGPMYVGNPGDYVDAREFEQLLQQLAENDNSQRGAPPAAKSAVDGLPSVVIEQFHLNEGTAVCAICKDAVLLGEYAKQLPCLHLYHHDCILPWLNSRNSCPVCRYELPTDDPDYEDQRKKRDRSRSSPTRPNNQPSVETSSFPEHAQESGRDGNEEASEIVADRGGNSTEVMDNNIDNMDMERECEIEHDSGGLPANPLDRQVAARGTRRGWFSLAAGPVLSMVGLVLVICLGSRVMGGGLQSNGRITRLQQSNFLQENRIEQTGGSTEVQSRRHWWMPFQR
ncbi:hypothetical protein O6H91_Y229000 [Diphasiastrum complanatum]|nr:hypothetical protein O6H91_Y385900 [Diphasiastrum complanatum]KAJ7278088.1 hypothetical protein O6H91_Y385900 [Diphasiastrum complanatum]KAJ7294832.1 hypothetical protein O6H91_Y229000 [Diphasiastrum complanatum]KAJ7294833.1 hypothetical protein O6H91_Y229000 [Diphasiastrum complanatum]